MTEEQNTQRKLIDMIMEVNSKLNAIDEIDELTTNKKYSEKTKIEDLDYQAELAKYRVVSQLIVLYRTYEAMFPDDEKIESIREIRKKLESIQDRHTMSIITIMQR